MKFAKILTSVIAWIGRLSLPTFLLLLATNWLFVKIPRFWLFLPLQIFVVAMLLYVVLYITFATIDDSKKNKRKK